MPQAAKMVTISVKASSEPYCRSGRRDDRSPAHTVRGKLSYRNAPDPTLFGPVARAPIKHDPGRLHRQGLLLPETINTPQNSTRRVPCSGWTANNSAAVQPNACASAPGRSQKSIAASRSGTHRAGVRYRQGDACGDRSSIALRHTAAALGSRVGANSQAIRPSYGRRGSVTMRPEAGLPNVGWDGSSPDLTRKARPGVPGAGLMRLRRGGRTVRPYIRVSVLVLLFRRSAPADR